MDADLVGSRLARWIHALFPRKSFELALLRGRLERRRARRSRILQDEVVSDDPKVALLEQSLARLKKRLQEGFPERAAELKEALVGLGRGEPEARERIRRSAHRLRGIAGSYGHASLGARAELVELLARSGDDPPALVSATCDLIEALGQSRPDSIQTSEPEPPEPRRPMLAGEPRSKLLAVDDDASTRRLLELTLASMGGFEARVLAEPEDALVLLASEPFDLVIVDAMMPSMTGLEFARALRREEHGKSIPIAFLSAAAWDELGWALPDRAVWLRKPFRPRDLLSRVAELLTHLHDDT